LTQADLNIAPVEPGAVGNPLIFIFKVGAWAWYKKNRWVIGFNSIAALTRPKAPVSGLPSGFGYGFWSSPAPGRIDAGSLAIPAQFTN